MAIVKEQLKKITLVRIGIFYIITTGIILLIAPILASLRLWAEGINFIVLIFLAPLYLIIFLPRIYSTNLEHPREWALQENGIPNFTGWLFSSATILICVALVYILIYLVKRFLTKTLQS